MIQKHVEETARNCCLWSLSCSFFQELVRHHVDFSFIRCTAGRGNCKKGFPPFPYVSSHSHSNGKKLCWQIYSLHQDICAAPPEFARIHSFSLPVLTIHHIFSSWAENFQAAGSTTKSPGERSPCFQLDIQNVSPPILRAKSRHASSGTLYLHNDSLVSLLFHEIWYTRD